MLSILIMVVNSMIYAFIKTNLLFLLKHKLYLNKVDLIFKRLIFVYYLLCML